MLTVRLPIELDQRLRKLAKETNRTKAFYVRKALEATLDEFEIHYLENTPFSSISSRLTAEQDRIYAMADELRQTTPLTPSEVSQAVLISPEETEINREIVDSAHSPEKETSKTAQTSLFDLLGL